MFWIGQIMGIIALVILIVSFQINNKKRLLTLQIFSSLFFALQYLFLGAISGCLMNMMTSIRNIVFRKFKNSICLIIIIVIMITMSIFSYNGLISLLPGIVVIIYSIALWQDNLTITRITEVISCLLFIIYNIKFYAISGIISTIIEMVFAMIAIYRFDLRKEPEKEKVNKVSIGRR